MYELDLRSSRIFHEMFGYLKYIRDFQSQCQREGVNSFTHRGLPRVHSIVMDPLTYSRTKRVLHNTVLLLTDASHEVIQAQAPDLADGLPGTHPSYPRAKFSLLVLVSNSAVMRLLNLLVGERVAKMWKQIYGTNNLNQ